MNKLLYTIFLLLSVPLYADNINQRTDISPSAKLSIGKNMAKSFIKIEDKSDNDDKVNIEKNGDKEDRGSQSINSFNNTNDIPDEIITVIGGDVVNICFRCR